MTMLLAIWLACAALTGAARAQSDSADTALVPPIGMNERILSIPGDRDRPVTLQVTVYSPNGPGPFPLAVMNHGATKISGSNRGTRYHLTFAAYYFLSRGYAVVLPMMRGFAGSGGAVVMNGCDLAATGVSNAKDIRAVIVYFRAQRDIDASRIVVAGQSFGGWNTLALGTLNLPGVRGLVNFSGGMRESDCATTDSSLAGAAAFFGAHTRLPTLWFYGENDTLFPTRTWQAMHNRYTGAGGQAALVDIGRFMDDSHQMLTFPESLPIWTPRVDQFLAELGMPSTPVYPAYLPTPIPAATHFADVDDVSRVPYLNDRGRAVYRAFLTKPLLPRVFVVAPDGNGASFTGGFDPIARALAACGRNSANCQVYAVDRSVVWSQKEFAAAAPPVEHLIRRTVPAGVMTVLSAAISVHPDCTSRGMASVRIIQPPKYGTAVVTEGEAKPNFPQGSPFAVCNADKVPATEVDYTPARGFTGADSVSFEEVNVNNKHLAFSIDLIVK
jgi:dienelactone hydrolase